MTVFEAVILGIVQGLTEFLPISSSGHLVLAQHLFGFEKPMVAFGVVLHCGTLLAVLTFLARDIVRMVQEGLIFIVRFPLAKNKKDLMREYPYAIILLWVTIATAVTAALGFLFQDTIEQFFGSLKVVGIAWILMGGVLMFSPKFSHGKRSVYEMNFWDAISIGLAQAVSIIPGVSRVGLTVLTGMGRGVEQIHAARFSFLISIPVIMGVGLLKLRGGIESVGVPRMAVIAGFFASAFVGYFAIVSLIKLLQHGKFYFFGFYCLLIGIATLVYHFLF